MSQTNADPDDTEGIQYTDEELSGPIVDRRTTVGLLGAAGLGALAGCSGGGSGNQQATTTSTSGGGGTQQTTSQSNKKTGGRLKAGWFTGSIDVLDPAYISVGQYFQVAANIFNGLVTLKKDLTLRGDLAKDWKVTNDGKTFTFTLRKGVTFHNGTKFTADDVKYTINRTISKKTPAASKLSSLKPVDQGGVVVKDDYTVQINFKKAMAPALIYLSRGPGRAATIVNKQAINKMGEKQYKITPVGTGPFKVSDHQVGDHITLDKFENYFKKDENGNALPYLDGVDIKPIPDPSTLTNALQSGDIEFSNLVPLQKVDSVKSASNVTIDSGPGPNWYGLGMNETKKPFDSQKARLGIAKLIDNKKFVQKAYFGHALPDHGPINKATAWVWRDNKPTDQNYDPQAGKKLVKEAGADGASFSILATKSNLRAAKVIRQQLNSAGFNVDIEQVTSSTYWDRYQKLNYDVTISGSVGDPDPDQSLWNFFRKPDDGGVWNWTHYTDDKINQWLGKQRRELDRSNRKQTLQNIEDRLIKTAPFAFLMHQNDILAYGESVQGFVHIPYMRDFATVSLSK